jgi:nitrogen regulatory protein PII
MKRVEIIINQALEIDVIEALEDMGYGKNFTYFHHVKGRGTEGRREGSSIWPEENNLFLIFMSDEEANEMLSRMKKIKAEFPTEGTHCYISEGPADMI